MIDKELGGTAPLDVIVDAPADFFTSEAEEDDLSLMTNLMMNWMMNRIRKQV